MSTCAWCGATATGEREVEPEQAKRDGTVVRRAVVVPVCADHGKMVDRNVRVRQLRTSINRKRSQLPRYQSAAARAGAEAELHKLERELQELEAVAA